ncbi:Sel1-repeat containing protein [Gracilaria domingensis]|nr:Sel1-repeat containing protein [Gracilaria domingensis]
MSYDLRSAKNFQALSAFEVRVCVLCDIAKALAFLHRQRVYHAALKPENVLLRMHTRGLQGPAKLDVTCVLRRALRLPLSRPRIYEPPEVYSNGFEAYYTGDIWSIGVLASFLLTDVSSEEDDTEFFKLALTKGYTFPARAWARRVRHTRMRNLIGKCLAELPGQRITAQQLVEELQAILRFNNASPQGLLNDEKGLEILGEKPFGGAPSASAEGHYDKRTERSDLPGRESSRLKKKKSPSPRKYPLSESGLVSLSSGKKESRRSDALCPAKRGIEKENPMGAQLSDAIRRKWERERLSEMEIETELTVREEVVSSRATPVQGPSRLDVEIPKIDLTGSDENSICHDTENDSSPVKIRRKRRRLLTPEKTPSKKSVSSSLSSSKAQRSSPKGVAMRSSSTSTRSWGVPLFTFDDDPADEDIFASNGTQPISDTKRVPELFLESIRQDRKKREICRSPLRKDISRVKHSKVVGGPSESGSGVTKRPSKQNAHEKPPSSSCVDGPGDQIMLTGNATPIKTNTKQKTRSGQGQRNRSNLQTLARQGIVQVKSEPEVGVRATSSGPARWFTPKERSNTITPVNNASGVERVSATSVKRDPELQPILEPDDPTAIINMSYSYVQRQVDVKVAAPKAERRKRSRSRSVEAKEPKDEKKIEVNSVRVTAPNTPWAGRMRRRSSRRYSEEAYNVSDSDSVDFVGVPEEPLSGSQANSSRHEKQEKKQFKQLVSINDKALVNISGSGNNVELESIMANPSRNEPFLLDSDVNGIYALGVLKGSKDGLDPFQYFKRESGKGDTMAQVRLGILYENGFHCQLDYGEAFFYFELAASKENNEGRLRLARCYEEGRGVSKNESAAVALYLQAAAANSPVAHYKAAKCFLEGRGAIRDIGKAVSHLEKAVEGDLLEAAYCLAQLYNAGKDVLQDCSKAFYLYGSAAVSGFVPAEVKLAHCYAKGKGCRRNISKAVELYKKAANANDPEALYSMGLLFEDGQGVKTSVTKALQSYIASAQQGYPPGITALGQCYLWGYGVPQDFAKAKSLFQSSAEALDALAMLELGSCYKEGNGCDQDIDKAVHYYKKASEHGNAVAMTELGECYYYGKGVEADHNVAFSLFQKAADNGAAEGYRWVGDCYADSLGTERDYKKASQMYRKAIDLGSSTAQLCLGSLYEHGSGVERNKSKAIQLYRKAADKGNFTAMNNLGILYEKGELVKQDYAKAVSYYKKAKELGCVDAICNLGDCYAAGNGVQKDVRTAFKLYEEAAEGGLASAVCELGVCYYRGRGVAPDYKRAMELLESVKADEPEALRQLGIIQYDGIAVAQDYEKACELFRESIREGNKNACLSLAICLLNGNGVEKDEKAAIESLREAANSGNLAAYMYLGNCYYDGIGVGKNLEMAIECFKKGYDADPMLS